MAVNNSFAYIEKTLPGVVDKVFAQESLTDALIGKNEIKLEFLDARTVKIFLLASTGLTNYQRGGHGVDNNRGAVASTTQTFTLSQERYSEIPLDKLDTLDDGETVLGHLGAEFARTKVVQEFDAFRFSKLAGYTNKTLGNRVSETIGDNEIIAKFNSAFKWLAENKVPEADQIIYVSPDVMEKIRNTSELAKRLSPVTDMDKNIKFAIEKYENRRIVVVPSDEFFTDIIIGDGYYPSANSKKINFLIVWEKAPIIIKKLDHVKVYNSQSENGAYLGYVGYLLTNLYYHDLFVPKNKRLGIYCSVSEEDAVSVSSTLKVSANASTESKKTVIDDVFTIPGGILFDKLYLSTDASRPSIGSVTTSLTEITFGEDAVAFTPNDEHNWFVASLDGKAVAVSNDYTNTLPKGE